MTSATSVKVTYCFLLCYIQNSDNADYRDTWDRVVKDSTDDTELSEKARDIEIQNVKGGNYAFCFIRNAAAMQTHCGLQRLGTGDLTRLATSLFRDSQGLYIEI